MPRPTPRPASGSRHSSTTPHRTALSRPCEVAGLPEPTTVHGVTQRPMEGVSMAYSFDDAEAPGRHGTQYFEIFCNRAIDHRGWTAVAKHKDPWETDRGNPDEDVWEL
jgi:arylsulfatase A-like enzyme